MSYGVDPADVLTVFTAIGAVIRIGAALLPLVISLF